MEFVDKTRYEMASKIINEVFWKKYEPTIVEDKPWHSNLNTFLVKEWHELQGGEGADYQFTREEEELLAEDAMQILLDKLNVEGDEFEECQEEVNWDNFDDLIGYYACQLKGSK